MITRKIYIYNKYTFLHYIHLKKMSKVDEIVEMYNSLSVRDKNTFVLDKFTAAYENLSHDKLQRLIEKLNIIYKKQTSEIPKELTPEEAKNKFKQALEKRLKSFKEHVYSNDALEEKENRAWCFVQKADEGLDIIYGEDIKHTDDDDDTDWYIFKSPDGSAKKRLAYRVVGTEWSYYPLPRPVIYSRDKNGSDDKVVSGSLGECIEYILNHINETRYTNGIPDFDISYFNGGFNSDDITNILLK